MFKVTINELQKIFARRTVYVFMGVILIFSLFNLAGSLIANSYLAGKSFGQIFPLILFDGVGSFVMPMLVILLVVNMITDEYADGTIKLPLLRKVSRNQLLLGKMCALGIVLLVFLVFLLLLGYGLGIIFFGWGEQFLMKGKSYTSLHGIILTLTTYGVSLLSYISFGMVILLFAVLISNAASVVSIGTALLVTSLIAEYIIPNISPYLVSNYFNVYRLLASEAGTGRIALGLLVILIYSFVFYIFSFRVFNKKDLLT